MRQVKPLKWSGTPARTSAQSATGRYVVYYWGGVYFHLWGDGPYVGNYGSMAAAMAACQSQHESLVLAELEPVCDIRDLPEYLQLPYEGEASWLFSEDVVVRSGGVVVYACSTVAQLCCLAEDTHSGRRSDAYRLALEFAKL